MSDPEAYKAGDKSRAYCSDCDKLVSTTLQRRDEYSKRYLCAVCDQCGATVAFAGRPDPRKPNAEKQAEYFDTWTEGDGQVRVRVYEGDWNTDEALVPVFERTEVVRIYGVSDFTLCEQAELLLARMTDSSGPLLSSNKFTALVDYPNSTEGMRPTVRLDGTLIDECKSFANITGSHIVPAGVYVSTPAGSGVARVVMRLLHDFNLYEHERSHDF